MRTHGMRGGASTYLWFLLSGVVAFVGLLLFVLLFSREVTAVVLLASGEIQDFSRTSRAWAKRNPGFLQVGDFRSASAIAVVSRALTIPHLWYHQGWAGAVCRFLLLGNDGIYISAARQTLFILLFLLFVCVAIAAGVLQP